MVSFYCYNYNHFHNNYQNRPCHNRFLSDVANVAVTLHASGSSTLNNDPDCTLLMESVLMHFCSDYYTFMFIFNRFLYSEFFRF